ncbi:acyltransferase family protein [Clostridium psychrophilum]|uniref:acyltransferase family protein n=1 Tax=Clostridium psychrophilum TaxID=132926 RepID=UPI001C0AED29|nr:acyltransferase [Clostridium psychrophilum]MBU3181840.1 acyltransferase [Clostridium psychrophilum]
MEIQKEKGYLNNISLLRTFAILIVVLGHSMVVYQYNWGIYTPLVKSSFFNSLKIYIDTFQMPLFIFISGYMYYYCRKECGKYKKLGKFSFDKIKRLLVPYICVAIMYVLPIRIMTDYKGYHGYNVFKIIYKYILTGLDAGHLWYLLAIFEIFIVFYLFEAIINKMGVPASFAIIACANIISYKFPNVFQISISIHYFMFFYLGYIVRNYEKDFVSFFKGKKNIVKIVMLFILQLLFLIVSFKISNDNIVGTLSKNSILLLCNVCGTLFYFLVLSLISNKYKSLNSNKTLKFLDKESFAIYLFHSPLIYIMLKYIADKDISPFLVVPSMFIIILFGSLGISYVIKKTKILKFIIGSSKVKKHNTTTAL